MEDPTFTFRLVLGLAALGLLALRDLVRHPRDPTRVKEYGFLFCVAAATMAYGLIHDLVTYSISREYFSIGKGIPEAEGGFGWPVIKMALMASWSAGLFVGLTLLVANNPKPGMPQLGYRELGRQLAIPLGCSAGLAVGSAAVGWAFAPAVVARAGLDSLGLEAPRAFVVVCSIHAGSYVGGLAGAATAAALVRRKRRRAGGTLGRRSG